MGSTSIEIQEMVRNTRERLEADFSKLGTRVHRFPRGLRGVDERYIVPGFVSLGPYHHGSTLLRETAELKHAAAHYFCEKSGHSVEEVYGKILSIAGEARSCYVDDAVANFTDEEFAVMMFLDGCYLLHYIEGIEECALLLNRMTLSTGPCMLRDIFLLENQLPWSSRLLWNFGHHFLCTISLLKWRNISISQLQIQAQGFPWINSRGTSRHISLGFSDTTRSAI